MQMRDDKNIKTHNPFEPLNKSQIDLYFTLLSLYRHYEKENLLADDGSFIASNELLGNMLESRPETVSRNIRVLQKEGYISLVYRPDSKGTIRKIFLKD